MRRVQAPKAQEETDKALPLRISAREKALILKEVADKHGELTPELVVRESDPSSDGVARRLAMLIGWGDDDAAAAKKWRIECARTVIRSAEPELIDLGVIQIKAPYYVHDPAKVGKQGYVPLLSMKTEQQAAEDLLRAEITAAVGALERAYSIAVGLGMESETAEIQGALAVLGRAPAAVQEIPQVRAARRARA